MSPEGARWEVTAQREDWQVDPTTGQAAQGMAVTFRTATGQVGSVFVAAADYTPDKVRRMIAARAEALDAVAGLKG